MRLEFLKQLAPVITISQIAFTIAPVIEFLVEPSGKPDRPLGKLLASFYTFFTSTQLFPAKTYTVDPLFYFKNMRYRQALWTMTFAVILLSCKKRNRSIPPAPPEFQQVLLKDMVIQTRPSPYYHFEYNIDGMITKASFLSGLAMYDVMYNGNNISEMRNNTMVNKDRLQYVYDNTGKIEAVKYVNEAGIVFRRCVLSYNGQQLKEIEWQTKEGNGGFIIDRTVTFMYLPDGNVQQITDHRPAITGQPDATYLLQFEQYDSKINPDGFSLLHEENDHLLLLPGILLQKNNPRKVIRTGSGVNYIIDYVYTYNNDNKPLTKTGNVLFTSGSGTGQTFQSNTTFTYY